MLAVGTSVAHAQDFKAFPACVDDESLAMMERQLKAGAKLYAIDTDAIAKKVYELCRARHLQGMKDPPFLWDLRYAQTVAKEKHNGLMRADIARQQRERSEREAKEREENAPKLKAEGEAANARYRECLYSHARLLALNSTEPAEIVTRATFASCRSERAAIAAVHARYKDPWFDEETLVMADKLLSDKVLLEVIKQRALPRSAPAKPPAAPQSDRGA
jgi:glycerol-3-phosphate dehydrogenase